jgi:alpha-ketoglutarate-dependent taurine dioxygenase
LIFNGDLAQMLSAPVWLRICRGLPCSSRSYSKTPGKDSLHQTNSLRCVLWFGGQILEDSANILKGGFWNFTSNLASQDTAYTQLGLPAHTDTTYFSDPAGLQMFHLLSHTDGEGGESLLVDGFRAAAKLQRSYPEAYEVLKTTNIYSHASGNEGISIQPYRSFPTILEDTFGEIVQIRWNSSDRAVIDLNVENMDRWYSAAR